MRLFFQAIFDVIINKLNHLIDILIDVMSLSIIILIPLLKRESRQSLSLFINQNLFK